MLPAPSEEELDRVETAWRIADIDRRQVDQRIANQRELIAAEAACAGFPTTRPPA